MDKGELIRYYQSQEEDYYRMYLMPHREYQQRRRLEVVKDMIRTNGDLRGKILDVGCGDGYASSVVLEGQKYVRFFGLDLSPIKLKKTQRHIKNSSVIIGDAEVLPYKSEEFDVVFCFETIEHLPNPLECCREIYRVLKPNGVCFLCVPIDSPLQEYLIRYFLL